MRRREFITLAGGAAVSPVVARAQRPSAPKVGLLLANPVSIVSDAFIRGLASVGFSSGRDIELIFKTTGDYSQLPLLARELTPGDRTLGMLVNPSNARVQGDIALFAAAVRALGREFRIERANDAASLDRATAAFARDGVRTVLVNGDPYFTQVGKAIAELTTARGLAAMFNATQHVRNGGLISYGASFEDSAEQAGRYAARVLRGDKPADLPVLQPTRFDLAINRNTAKALGLTFPTTLRTIADEVIE